MEQVAGTVEGGLEIVADGLPSDNICFTPPPA